MKAKRIISIVLMTLVILVFLIGGVMKLLGAEPPTIVQFLTKYGFGAHIALLGVAELMIGGLLLYPKTNKIGFLLASSYFGAAFCLELSGGLPLVSPFILAILWIGMFLKNRAMFLPTAA